MIENHLSQVLVEDKDLKRFIKSYWVLKYQWKDEIEGRLNPLATPHIVVNIGEKYRLSDRGKDIEKGSVQVFYPSEKICEIRYPRNTHIIGIELSSQGFYYLMKEETKKNIGKILPLEEVDEELSLFIIDNIEDLVINNFKGLSNYLYSRFKGELDNRELLLIERVIEELENTDLTIEEIAKKLDKGIRTIERKFKRNTGLTMKKYRRIVRLNSLLTDIYMKNEVEWAELAIKHGFSDQAHMIKELRSYIGNSPREYLRLKDLLGDIFIVGDVILQ